MPLESRIQQVTQIVAIVVLVAGCLVVLQPFVAGMLSAAILCFSTWPAYARIERAMRGRAWLAAMIMTLLIVLVLVLPLALIAAGFVDDLPKVIEGVRGMIAQGVPLPPDWVASIPVAGESIDARWREIASSREKLHEALGPMVKPAQQFAVKFGVIIGEGVLQFSLIAFVAFFFYRDGPALVTALRNTMSRVSGTHTAGLFQTVGGTIQGVVYGIVGTAIVQGVLAAIGFLIAGVPAAALLGFFTFLLSIVPVGPPLIWGTAAAWLAYQDQTGWAIFMVVWGFFVVSGVDNIIKPLLISRGASMPFILVFIGVLGGVLAFGFIGIFLGPALLAVGYNLIRQWTAQPAG